VKETAHGAAEAIKTVLSGPSKENVVNVQGENMVEVKTNRSIGRDSPYMGATTRGWARTSRD